MLTLPIFARWMDGSVFDPLYRCVFSQAAVVVVEVVVVVEMG